jgi:hypothetical protein
MLLIAGRGMSVPVAHLCGGSAPKPGSSTEQAASCGWLDPKYGRCQLNWPSIRTIVTPTRELPKGSFFKNSYLYP